MTEKKHPAEPDPLTESTGALRQAVLAWYDANRRSLPWRAAAGEVAEPYHVWLSEIMLQQTTVAAVEGYFTAFLTRWPQVEDLAAAPLDDVMHAWAGLGYYARARNLHRCAQVVAGELGGTFPRDVAGLRALPGVGEYTAAAIAAIAFGLPAAPVDANVERVAARLADIREPLPAGKRAIKHAAAMLEAPDRPGDWAQALMDLGSSICTAKTPKCLLCPASPWCQGLASGEPERLPTKPKKKARPLRHGIVYWLEREDGALLIRRRAPKGMLGGLWEFPSAGWDTKDAPASDPVIEALAPDWQALAEPVSHGFTHFELALEIRHARASAALDPPPDGTRWATLADMAELGLPTLMTKVRDAVLAALESA